LVIVQSIHDARSAKHQVVRNM